MGEVYRARDPRLSREVAIKLVSTDGATAPDRLRRFEIEARAAAQLSHPNVVTVFDVGTHDGHPYLVLELLEGETLREALRGGIPPLRQAVAWALEVSRGLAAAHERGIVHRDLKPDNVFLTSDRRVKVLDFGLAKLREPLVSDEADRESPTATKNTAPGVLLGTVGYMAPEQVKGQTPDPRTDVFALGAMLFEMVSGRRAFAGDTAPEVLAAILRDEPPALESLQHGVPASVETVVRRCLAKRPVDRFSSARAVEAALETVLSTLEPSRVSVGRAAESQGPYPGLSAFTERDAERFFGREAEVEALWEKLRRGRLLAVIGPSGAGKTSFVRAGLVPARPSGWGALVATPGGAPLRALAQALVEELPSDADTVRQLLGFDDPDVAFSMVRKWRETHLEAVLVLDQFEELFALNPPEVQERFAGLLGRLAREADVHVLLSLRDDFLMRCHEQEALVEVFEHLTPLGPLSEEGTRQALTEPAEREGFAFEDDALVAEMLEAVEGARGGLPLLAFAVARLWEKRDRDRKLLARMAYEEIGGVAGALAQHAEQTLERIGTPRESVVREIFRNLVTAQWTRAVAGREQLLSALPDAAVGAQVLDSLVDARLLTAYEVQGGEGGAEGSSRQRIEIVHESLLRAWPRLVRWQAQDEEGAVLRDQLKQAAHLWEEKGRPDDLLWTGTSEREYELWRDRYPGRLTALEEEYSRAMVDRTRRRTRLRRAAVVSLVFGLAAVAGAIGVSRQQALEQARRAEASKLVALGRAELDRDPSTVLAYALKSLEVADTPEARRLAVGAVWRGSPARFLPLPPDVAGLNISLSPDGRWLATAGFESIVGLFSQDGHLERRLNVESEGLNVALYFVQFGPRSERLLTWRWDADRVRAWTLDGRETTSLEAPVYWVMPAEESVFTWGRTELGSEVLTLREWSWVGGAARILSTVPFPAGWMPTPAWLFRVQDQALEVRPRVGPDAWGDLMSLGKFEGHHNFVSGSPDGHRLAAVDASGRLRVWSTDDGELLATAQGMPPEGQSSLYPDRTGSRFAWGGTDRKGSAVVVWREDDPADADPQLLQGLSGRGTGHPAFHPSGDQLAASDGGAQVLFWPLEWPRARVLPLRRSGGLYGLHFTDDSRRLLSCGGGAWLWPLSATDGFARVLSRNCGGLELLPSGGEAAVWDEGAVSLVPLDGGSPRRICWSAPSRVAVNPDGTLLAAAPYYAPEPARRRLHLVDLESGAARTLPLDDRPGGGRLTGILNIHFAWDGSLLSGGVGGIRRWDLATGEVSSVLSGGDDTLALIDVSGDSRRMAVVVGPGSPSALELTGESEVQIHDLEQGARWTVTSHGPTVNRATLDVSGDILVTGDREGVVRAGPASGGEPHLLPGHSSAISALAVSPDGRWIASSAGSEIRLWPVPDMTRPPFHTLPHEELKARLRSFTNLEVIEDDASPTGYRTEIGPFPGWEDVPTW
jgi:WD40 repeat protein